MKLEIDVERMKSIYGDEIIDVMSSNEDIIRKNIQTLEKLKFNDISDFVERCIDVFLYYPKDFENKINKLIQELGVNYVEIIENDINYIQNI